METMRDNQESPGSLEPDVWIQETLANSQESSDISQGTSLRSQETPVKSQEKGGGGILGKLRRRSSSASTTPVKVSQAIGQTARSCRTNNRGNRSRTMPAASGLV